VVEVEAGWSTTVVNSKSLGRVTPASDDVIGIQRVEFVGDACAHPGQPWESIVRVWLSTTTITSPV
jgi:hypothetical protein